MPERVDPHALSREIAAELGEWLPEQLGIDVPSRVRSVAGLCRIIQRAGEIGGNATESGLLLREAAGHAGVAAARVWKGDTLAVLDRLDRAREALRGARAARADAPGGTRSGCPESDHVPDV